MGEASVRSGKLADEWVAADGAVKEVLRQRLEATSQELSQLKQASEDTAWQLGELAERQHDLAWANRVLSNFRTVWDAMNTFNRDRLLCGLLDRVVVDVHKGNVLLHFVDHASALAPMGATTAAA
jgi:hypothetical protein